MLRIRVAAAGCLALAACLPCEARANDPTGVPPPAAPRPSVWTRQLTAPTGIHLGLATAAAARPAEPAAVAIASELSEDGLVRQVLAHNPTLAQMAAAAQAAAARYPQVTSLDDPMVAASVGPATIGARDLDFAYRLEIAQKYPWPGKLQLRGRAARAEACAAQWEVEDARLQLVEAARTAFADYFLVARAVAVNEEGLRLLGEFRRNAETRYTTGLTAQQDVLQADVEIGRQRERLIALGRMWRVAVARINTLMHLPPDAPLPPPPERLPAAGGLPGADMIRTVAQGRRPDLLALAERGRAEQAQLGLAYKEYYPDLEPFVMWDKFMGNMDDRMAPQVGVRLNLPVRKARRSAAVAEGQARVAQRQAELARATDQVNFEVQQAYEQVRESDQALRLYEREILPAARENVRAAQAAYVTGRIPFLSLVEAERNLVSLLDRSYETAAEYSRRRATLERAAGGPLPPPVVPAAPGP